MLWILKLTYSPTYSYVTSFNNNHNQVSNEMPSKSESRFWKMCLFCLAPPCAVLRIVVCLLVLFFILYFCLYNVLFVKGWEDDGFLLYNLYSLCRKKLCGNYHLYLLELRYKTQRSTTVYEIIKHFISYLREGFGGMGLFFYVDDGKFHVKAFETLKFNTR